MARSALFSPSVLSSAASGHRLPTLRVALAFVASCDGDAQLWERRWRAVSGAVEPPAERTREVSAEAERRARRVVGRPADVSPAQLPLRPRGFAGHAVERARLVAEGGVATRPLVVSGPVGVGKTDLALRYAHDMAVAMPDGQLYADLGTAAAQGGSPEAVVRAFLRALGVTDDQVPEAPWQQAGLYRSLLARRRLVVLLDGVRDEQQVRPLLGETSGSLLILISRRLLLGLSGVRRIQLGVLPRHESVAMLRALAGTQADADPEACDRLAELCGDLPLALDVAGRRLAARPDRFPRDVVEHAARRGGLLEWLRVGDISVREHLLSAYAQTSLPARSVLDLVGKLPLVDIGLDSVARALGVTRPSADDLLEELVEAGMLRRGRAPDGYRLDPLLRSFVREQSTGPGRRLAIGPRARAGSPPPTVRRVGA